MEFKLFGPGDYPGNPFQKGLEVLLGLDERQWKALETWFLETETFDADTGVSSPSIAASSLTPDQFVRSTEVLQFILESWYMRGLSLGDIQRDLMLLGKSRDEIERLGALLERLSSVRERVYKHYIRAGSKNAVLPTLEECDAVCDLRPVFENTVELRPQQLAVRHTKLVGFSHVVLVELVTEDPLGRRHRLAFQMTEETLQDLQAALKRVHEQLDILKEKIGALSINRD